MVILMHGFMSDKQDRVISAIASRLREMNIAYIRFDFNGHGASDGDFQDMTVLNEIEDAKKVYEYARSLDFVGDIALFGHSQGGVVASMLAGELGSGEIGRLVLMAPATVLKDNALNGIMFNTRFDPEDLPEYVTVYGHRVGREYLQTAQTLPIYETALQYGGPVCVIHGKEDNIVPYSYGVRYSDGYQNAELHLLDGEDHAFSHHLDEAADIAVRFLSDWNADENMGQSDNDNNDGNNQEDENMDRNITITVGGTQFAATLEDNEAGRAFAAMLPLTLDMSEMNGNEKYHYLDESLPTESCRPGTIQAGDLMLYGSSCVVLFYETFSSGYSYTRLGRIGNPEGLAAAIGGGNVSVTFSAQ